VLEKAFAEAQAQNSQHRAQMQDMQDSLKKAAKVVQVTMVALLMPTQLLLSSKRCIIPMRKLTVSYIRRA